MGRTELPASHGRGSGRSVRSRGSVVPMVVACIGVLVATGLGSAVAAAVVVDHRRAQSAADLAALAGAQASSRGEEPCGPAAGIAAANGAHLVACTSGPADVRVLVEVEGHGRWGALFDVRAEARAGWS